jgi:hypothetical protein
MRDDPSGRRFVCACAAALLVPVLAAGGLFSFDSPPASRASIIFLSLLIGLPIALLHFLVLALPAYAVLREYWPLSWWAAALSGFIVGAMPAGLLGLATLDPASDAITLSFAAGLLGLSGGVAFWAVLAMKKGGPLPDRP